MNENLGADSQNEARVKWCKKMIRNYENSSPKISFDNITGNESWVYKYNLSINILGVCKGHQIKRS